MLVDITRPNQPQHNLLPLFDVGRSRHHGDALPRAVLDGSEIEPVGVGVLLQPRNLPGVDVLPLLAHGRDVLHLQPRQRQLASQLLHRHVYVYIFLEPRKWRSKWHMSSPILFRQDQAWVLILVLQPSSLHICYAYRLDVRSEYDPTSIELLPFHREPHLSGLPTNNLSSRLHLSLHA